MRIDLRLAAALLLAMGARPAGACDAPVSACERPSAGALALIVPGKPINLVVSGDDDDAVRVAAANVRADLASVGGGRVSLADTLARDTTVIAGTLGHSVVVDALVRTGKLDVGGLAGQWEGYVEQVVDHPAPGVARALVIAGADRRGTIFGLYDLSAKVGVSPWTWWADVPPQRHATLYLTAGRIADHPVVKYRGIFLNDEEPALGGWARAEFGGVNHLFYEKVFTLLLRSKANFLWPAMWGKSLWEDDPASAPLATKMGIVLGTSHHEPMGRANIDWKKAGGGAWDYTTNASALQAFWRRGIERRGDAEDLVTVGMRGDADEPMTQGTATGLLERIVTDQRRIIAEVTGKPAAETPQVWALYKEVQDYYDAGMRVPNDVTLLFSDDNWGNIRRLPEPGTKRAGGSGVYYHFDYVGDPRNYKWIDTNAVPRIWQQMAMARAFGADRMWIVNVGDLKPMEYPTSFFLAMAWNPDRMTLAAMETYPARWATQQFGPALGPEIGALITRYGQLASRRKPELVDADSYDLAGGEWRRVLNDWDELEREARRVGTSVPAEAQDAYYELVLHRIEAMANLHRLYEAVAEARATRDPVAHDRWAGEARTAFDNDRTIRRRFEADTAGGKWAGMMAQTHIGYTGWQEPPADVMPSLAPVAPPKILEVPPATRWAVDDATAVDGGGLRWQRVAGFTGDGAAMIAAPITAASIEQPGGASPHLTFDWRVERGGAYAVTLTAAPGLDVRGEGRQRFALSVDDGKPVIVDLLAGDTPPRWGAAVIANRRTGTAMLDVAKPGRHRLAVWLVDPQIVIEGLEAAAR